MQKKTYEEATIKITFFNADEVIVASGDSSFTPSYTAENDETEIL